MNEAIVPIIGLTLQVGFVAIIFTLPLALLLALLLARTSFWGKNIVQTLIFAPLVLPPVVTGLVLLHLFTPNGVIGAFLARFGVQFAFDWTGAALAAGLIALPLMVRPIRLALELIDEELIESLTLSGMGRFERFWRVLLPLGLPGMMTGAILGFAKALGEFGATITFVANIPGDTQTLSLAIFNAFQSPGQEGLMWQLSLISLVLSLAALLLAEKLNYWLGLRLGLYVSGGQQKATL